MKLYNVKTKQEEYVDYVQDENGILYTQFLSKADLKKRGYLLIEEEAAPTDISEFNRVESKVEVKNDVCYKTYKIVPKDLPELTDSFKKKVQSLLNNAARKSGFEDIVSACSYAGYDNPFRKEGEAFGVWRANVWRWGYALLEDIKTGKHKMPTSFEELLPEMPKLKLVALEGA
jgi:hypothetical protein